jgi:uncharacterized membrane protein YcfT
MHVGILSITALLVLAQMQDASASDALDVTSVYPLILYCIAALVPFLIAMENDPSP